MNNPKMKNRTKKRGAALVTTFIVLMLISVAAVTYVDSSTAAIRTSRHQTRSVQATHLCEAGVQEVLRDLWRPFKVEQNFFEMEADCTGASPENPMNSLSGELEGVGRFSAGVIAFESPIGDPYVRNATIRAVGWHDYDDDGQLDDGEPRKVVDVTARFELARSQVFDYTYFVNNYGWMYGFQESWLIVNGDMRANGNFEFKNGSPTINGSVVAAQNEKLDPPAEGLINEAPVKWNDTRYANEYATGSHPHKDRWRQPYNPSIHGAIGTPEFEKWRDLVYFSQAQLESQRIFGAAMMDAQGRRAWERLTAAQTATYQIVDVSPTKEVVMPDLSDLDYYVSLSQNYINEKEFYQDGTPNPDFGQSPYLEVWNSTTSAYDRLTTDGVVNGSAVLVGTLDHPIRIHGPVTVTQDAVIKGYIEGQGTIYTGRNTHVVGSVRYKNGPDFRGSDMQTIENTNEKKDFLGLAARGSVMMGDPTKFGNPYPLAYMTPPFTKGRYDDYGNYIPPFNAMEVDATGRMRYQSVVPDSVIAGIAEGVNQIDAIMYTNYVGGGNVGTAGGGVTINGSIISKDESMVVWSLPIRMNYDNRIRERDIDNQPLIDLELPRSPALLRSTWQDKGFTTGYAVAQPE